MCTAFAALSADFWIASRKAADLVEPAAQLLEAAGRLRCKCNCADIVVFQPTTDLQSLALSWIGGFLACAPLVWRYSRPSVEAVPVQPEPASVVEAQPVFFAPIDHVEPRRAGKRRNPIGIIDLS